MSSNSLTVNESLWMDTLPPTIQIRKWRSLVHLFYFHSLFLSLLLWAWASFYTRVLSETQGEVWLVRSCSSSQTVGYYFDSLFLALHAILKFLLLESASSVLICMSINDVWLLSTFFWSTYVRCHWYGFCLLSSIQHNGIIATLRSLPQNLIPKCYYIHK